MWVYIREKRRLIDGDYYYIDIINFCNLGIVRYIRVGSGRVVSGSTQ